MIEMEERRIEALRRRQEKELSKIVEREQTMASLQQKIKRAEDEEIKKKVCSFPPLIHHTSSPSRSETTREEGGRAESDRGEEACPAGAGAEAYPTPPPPPMPVAAEAA